MYKKQLTLQKILCFLALVSSVVIFLYALGIMTDLYDTLMTQAQDAAYEAAVTQWVSAAKVETFPKVME